MICISKVTNVQVYGLDESIYRSGYPMMSTAPTEEEFRNEVDNITNYRIDGIYSQPHIKRAISLANSKGGGHDQFLTGITVQFDLTFSNKAWVEFERYVFANFVSSMSTLHRIGQMNASGACNDKVDPMIAERIDELQFLYNSIDGSSFPDMKKEAYLKLLYNLPSGFELTAGITTNYRCLKNILSQRDGHRLKPDWGVFCTWVKTLPMASELIIGGVK